MLIEQPISSSSRHSPKSPHSRPNFSQCGKKFDQDFYLLENTSSLSPSTASIQMFTRKSPRQSTTAFTSVSRQKRGNFRVSIPDSDGEYSHKPDHLYGRERSPSWSFARKQRYGTERVTEYQICERHPIMKKQDKQRKLYSSSMSIKQQKQSRKSKMHAKHSSSFLDTNDHSRNYSIILPRKTSAVELFSKSKIRNPFYLSKNQIMNEQQELQGKKVIEPCPKGYIEFYKKKNHPPISNMKGFETYQANYTHEKQFNNFSLNKYHLKPSFNVSFDKQMDRDQQPKNTYGPNLQQINIDPIRPNRKNTYLNIHKFVSKVKTRFDRLQPEASTRLQYDLREIVSDKTVAMEKVIGRNKQLHPIVDPAIKKAGDEQMKIKLKQFIRPKQINQAMSPKTTQKY